jgi:hypothetical protein
MKFFNEAIILKMLRRCYGIPALTDHLGLANIQAFLPAKTAQKHVERRKDPVEYFGRCYIFPIIQDDSRYHSEISAD